MVKTNGSAQVTAAIRQEFPTDKEKFEMKIKVLLTTMLLYSSNILPESYFKYSKKIDPMPSKEAIPLLRKEYKTVLTVPLELRGIWSSGKVPIEPGSIQDMNEIFHFCDDFFIIREAHIFHNENPIGDSLDYSVITSYSNGTVRGENVKFIYMSAADLKRPHPPSILTFHPSAKKMKYHHGFHGKIIYSKEFFYSKCPSDKK